MKLSLASVNRLLMIVTPLCIGLTVVAQQGEAAIITAADCTSSAVQAAINAAGHGDTVAIPAGDCTWTTTVTSTKGVMLQGAGQGSTILRDNVGKGGSTCSGGGPLIAWNVAEPNTFRLTGVTIIGVMADSAVCQRGHITINGNAKQWRLDHFAITPAQTVGILVDAHTWGLIDHLTFTGSFKNALRVEANNWGGQSWGDGSFAEAIDWGGVKAIYVEDSNFTDTGQPVGGITDCFSGGRLVFRHNTVSNGNLTSHGVDSDQRHRACLQQEYYDNSFTYNFNTPPAFVSWIRGGTGVFFNNTVTSPGGFTKMVQASNCRDAGVGCGGNQGGNWPPWGACNGSSSYDQNASGGYRCVDQPGSGNSNLISGNPPQPLAWVGNALTPIYVWNNKLGGSPNNTASGSANVQNNRDYFVGTAKPGYTPFAYPHPLQDSSAGVAPSVPPNLQLSRGSMAPAASAPFALTSRWDD